MSVKPFILFYLFSIIIFGCQKKSCFGEGIWIGDNLNFVLYEKYNKLVVKSGYGQDFICLECEDKGTYFTCSDTVILRKEQTSDDIMIPTDFGPVLNVVNPFYYKYKAHSILLLIDVKVEGEKANKKIFSIKVDDNIYFNGYSVYNHMRVDIKDVYRDANLLYEFNGVPKLFKNSSNNRYEISLIHKGVAKKYYFKEIPNFLPAIKEIISEGYKINNAWNTAPPYMR